MLKKTVALLVMCILLTACGQKGTEPTKSEVYYRFTDSVGNEVVLEEKPTRTAVLFSSYAELWQLSGGEVYLSVGDSQKRGFCGDEVLLLDKGAGREISEELLLSYEPDFIIGTADFEGQRKACETARNAGIPTALFRVETFEDYLYMLKICTDINENQEAYEKYGTEVGEEIDKIKTAVKEKEQKSILFIRAGSQASSTKAKRAEDHFAAEILKELGAFNIADNASVLVDGLSLEEVIRENPDEIFIAPQGDEDAAKNYMESVFESDGWKSLEAVKNKKYYFLPKELFNYKPNNRYAESYRYLAKLLYPEIDI